MAKTPGEIERAYEEIKRHLKLAGRDDRMRAEAETAVSLFEAVPKKAGDPLQMLDTLREALLSFGYSEEECGELLSPPPSPSSTNKPRKSGTAKTPAKVPTPQSKPENESITVPDAADFFQQEDEAALRQRVRWLDDKLGLDSQFLSKVLHQSEARLEKWKSKITHLPAESEGILCGLWQLILHLLSHYGNEEKRVRQLLEQRIPESQSSLAGAPRDRTVSPLCPPWQGAPSLKSYLEEHGVDAINRVNRWLMSLRFGDPYSMTSEATTWP